MNINPITKLDYPDPDVIRVDDTFYMVSTTMYFFPGCEILKSHDLVNWEHLSYVYDRLDSTPAQKMEGDLNIYGQGMWAASLRFHDGYFYVVFVANDTQKTYVYSSEDIHGPWKKKTLEGFYHDNSLLFDDDGKIYIVYGNKEVYIRELRYENENDNSVITDKDCPPEKLIVKDSDEVWLGYEGSHLYKRNGKYYLFMIHIPKSTGRRSEGCYISDSPYGPYEGRDVMDDTRDYRGSGVAQGGIVDSPDGKTYAILFQDSGAVGRIPVLMPVTWEGDFPVFGDKGKIPEKFETPDLRPGYVYRPLTGSDDFRHGGESFGFRPFWQFSHEPDLNLISRNRDTGVFTIKTDKVCKNVVQASNTLTQRTLFPGCIASVELNAEGLNDGDHAGLCILESCYGYIGITKKDSKFYLERCTRTINTGGIMGERHDREDPDETEMIEISVPKVRLYAAVSFDRKSLPDNPLLPNEDDSAAFFYELSGDGSSSDKSEGPSPEPLGGSHKLIFKLDHFTGARFGLFCFSAKEAGGSARFANFEYIKP